ncbi:hypothetical protein JCGZ_10770 [Jatropha curcas]|uniref:HhH-GPD domain-containing protein n=1 Tax=Jatropha curcas TaxID=180498 RepID=A0A067LI12_JATCU|nr:hypothetical protein JCGZ_10770 [Jatropha curcas]
MRRRGRKRAKIEANNVVANFPSARELAKVDEEFLKKRCNVGHRAKTIISLVNAIESERLKLDDFENALLSNSYEQIRSEILKIKGIGPFTCANILMCIGHYIDIPIDSETIRLVKKIHGRENCSRSTIAKDVKEIYGGYEPYQCLAYWFDLVKDYESRYGKLSELSPSSYHFVSGHIDPKPPAPADKQV